MRRAQDLGYHLIKSESRVLHGSVAQTLEALYGAELVIFGARGADGKPARLAALAAELVRLKVVR